MKKIAALIIFLSLAACATTARFEERLDSCLGCTEADLVRMLGAPRSAHNAGDVKFVTFRSERTIHIPGAPTAYVVSGSRLHTTVRPVGGREPENIEKSCEVTFELKDDRVTSWHWRGNDCTL